MAKSTGFGRALAVIALGTAAVLSASAEAGFTVTTQVSGMSYSGGALTVGSLAANTTYVENGVSFSTTSQGGSSYTDAAGTTVYIVEDLRTASTRAIPNEQIYVINSNASAIDNGSFTFSTVINVTNNGLTGNFMEGPSSLVLNLGGGDANYSILTSGLTPPTEIIGGTIFSASTPQATSGNINSQANGALSAIISASAGPGISVPEPASVTMLGLGALGVVGLMFRRARRV